MLRTLVYVATARGGLEAGLSRRDLDLGSTASNTDHTCFAFGTIRLWYDIAVFVAVLSFHICARYRGDYGPRRPLEARVISARSRDLDLGSTASLTPITVLCLWYHTTLV